MLGWLRSPGDVSLRRLADAKQGNGVARITPSLFLYWRMSYLSYFTLCDIFHSSEMTAGTITLTMVIGFGGETSNQKLLKVSQN